MIFPPVKTRPLASPLPVAAALMAVGSEAEGDGFPRRLRLYGAGNCSTLGGDGCSVGIWGDVPCLVAGASRAPLCDAAGGGEQEAEEYSLVCVKDGACDGTLNVVSV